MFYCLNVQLYHLWDKRWFVCAHIGQNRHIYPPSICGVHFDSYPLPLLRRLTVGAAIEKKFFWFLFFWFAHNLSEVWIENIIFWILHSLFLSRIIFFIFSWLRSYSDSYSILFRISVVLTHHKFSLDILLVWFRYIILDYNFGFCGFRFWISTRFYSLNFPRINFDLFQHCRFYALTLQLFISLTLLLVINKHLCLYEFVLCLF